MKHLPRHRLEQFVTTAAHLLLDRDASDHLQGCAHCTQRLESTHAARADYLAAYPADAFVRQVLTRAGARSVSQRRWPRRMSPLFGAVAAAAAALLWLVPAWNAKPVNPIHFKGSSSFEVYTDFSGSPALLHAGDAVPRSAQLAFAYRLTQPRHLLLLGIDQGGEITCYFPQSEREAPLAAGRHAQLPIGVQLDGSPGVEIFVAMFTAEPLAEPRARAALREAYRRANARGSTWVDPKDLELPGEQVSLWLRKS